MQRGQIDLRAEIRSSARVRITDSRAVRLVLTRRLAAALIGTAVLLSSLSPAAAVRNPSPKIAVAPSPNGLVMAGVPSQIAVTGTPRARISVRAPGPDDADYRIGTATPSVALPFTFDSSGIYIVTLRPATGPVQRFKVPVFVRVPAEAYVEGGFDSEYATDQSFSYGSVLLESSVGLVARGTTSFSQPAYNRCVLADVGATTTGGAISMSIHSTGAPAYTLTAAPGVPIGAAGIPIRGLAVVDLTVQSDGSGSVAAGVVWTCLNPLGLVEY